MNRDLLLYLICCAVVGAFMAAVLAVAGICALAVKFVIRKINRRDDPRYSEPPQEEVPGLTFIQRKSLKSRLGRTAKRKGT
ncbi:MAG: hypothetical protein HY290_16140 [Planctomycetia bacterium]|nr:hypothetical protein [Planctomycetia bacterium]